MKKCVFAVLALLLMATVPGDVSAAPSVNAACVFDGWASSSSSSGAVLVPVAGISQQTYTSTSATGGKYTAGTLTLNISGAYICNYTLAGCGKTPETLD
ncbi:MAG: hypothetical protein WA005_11770 [Candidatus Binataceae bacterium]